MKKLILALILLISFNTIVAQEEDVVYYNVAAVSYKTGMNDKETIWSDWYTTDWIVRIDYFEEQQTITVIKEESDFYVLESYVDSASYNSFKIYQFIASDRLDDKVTIELMIPLDKNGFFIVITDRKDNIVMYKIE